MAKFNIYQKLTSLRSVKKRFNLLKYQPGDDIIILHTQEEGKVVEVLNDKMLLVDVRGVRFPAYTDQIDFPYYHRFTKKQKQSSAKPAKKYVDDLPKEKSSPPNVSQDEGVWLSMVPRFALDDFNDEVVELFKLYLINKNDEGYRFPLLSAVFW